MYIKIRARRARINHVTLADRAEVPGVERVLGERSQGTHSRSSHTLGNLTLTGYNPECFDEPFHEKCAMPTGSEESPLRLNQGLGHLETWNEAEIGKRDQRPSALAVDIWPRTELSDETLDRY